MHGMPKADAIRTMRLERGAFLRIRAGAGEIISAHAGSVWVTEQDSLKDVVLRPGESFKLERRGIALVEAFSDASISVDR